MGDCFNPGMEPMLEMFIFETNQLLEQLEEILLNSEKSSRITDQNINEIFRIMHTIKGSSSMMMFNNIASVSHSIEDLFYFIRENKPVELNYSSICDIVLDASDFIKIETCKIERGNEANGNEKALKERIKIVILAVKGDRDSVNKPKLTSDKNKKFYISSYKTSIHNEDIELMQHKYIAKVFFDDDCQMENVRGYTLAHNLKDICGQVFHRPKNVIEDNSSLEYIIKNGFEIYFSTNEDQEKLNEFFNRALFVKSFELKSVESYEAEISSLKESESENYENEEIKSINNDFSLKPLDDKEIVEKSTKQNIISVNVEKLNKLMDLVGEIVISESMVTKNPELIGMKLEGFGKAARQLRKLTDELQDIVMSIRMIPIAATFNKMTRIVRDMGKKLEKEVDLIIIGEETEVDKNIIDHLSDPLMHLIRNAMDHGIEDIEERKLKGKPAKGKITLEAKNSGGDVNIIISDDGKGLDKEKILKKARECGAINKPENELSDKEIFSFILLPGLSTKENITEFSGRGVGMDVVKSNIEKVGGAISVESSVGLGTTINIRIPLTLAIIEGMEIMVGNAIYTLPIISIIESFRPEQKNIILDPDENEMIMIRGKCYPILRLHKLFRVATEVEEFSKGIIIVVETGSNTICLFADKLLGEQQVVVKPLPAYINKYIGSVKGIGGCTILGDGNISMIIDVNSIF